MCSRGTVDVDVGLNSFSKDGRKIRVGDCALFKPPQNSLPFIGIVRCLITSKECNLKFGVNWLYRASEVDLGKGTQLDAAPNELFYSFHEDEVPSASLLHPCKVAFFPEGVELPSGIASFICRRVYDVNQKCLWWLTDQNYIVKRQEEVDSLLSKTRSEMHATAQPGGRSPKTMNDTAPGSQVKTSSDGAQNVSSISSHGKGRKRERPDQESEPVKRVQKRDEGESHQPKSDSLLKTDISRITDRGGLVDHDSVEKLIHLMTPDKADKKIDMHARSILAGVVAATDKFDCLGWFVQLKGLTVFDEWLQEIHKGKVVDVNSQKDGDKSVEEFLLVLLRALDKLPVNLRALQMCNIGKSVNHLRSHKNLEIQRKVRGLVDTWKKRVEAEMNIDDGQPGSNMGVAWHARRTSEPSQGGHRNSCSSENMMKSSTSQVSASRMVSTKPTQCEQVETTTSTSPGYSKSTSSPTAVGVNSKDSQPTNAAAGESPDHMPMAVKDEKSSSSSQSHSQSSSSDHIKTAESLGKVDIRSYTSVSVGAGDTVRRTSRLRKTVSGVPEPVSRGAPKDRSNRSPLRKASMSEKLTRSGSVSEKMHDIDVHVADGHSHKLTVKLPNRGRSPAVSTNGGSVDELCPSNSGAASPACLDKLEKSMCASKEKGDATQVNDASDVTTKSWHSSDLKEALTGSDEADGTSTANQDEVRSTDEDQTVKLNELPKVISSLAIHEPKPWKNHEPSFSSMNALVESCVKHSEANALISVIDDDGMNLLASVASNFPENNSVAEDAIVAISFPENNPAAEDAIVANSGRALNVENGTHESSLGRNMDKQDTEKQEDSTSLATDGEGGASSSDKKPANHLSNSVLKKQNDGQLPDRRAVASNEDPMEATPDSKVGNQKQEINKSESDVKDGPSNNMDSVLDPKTPLDTDKADGLDSSTSDYSWNAKDGKPQNKEVPCHSNGVSDLNKASVIKNSDHPSTDAPHASSAKGMLRRGFDLNEGFTADEVKYEEQRSLTGTFSQASVHVTSPFPISVSVVTNGLPASVTVAAAAKGAFVPPEDLLRTRGELGWKGSAATSAFRPAERKKLSEVQVNTSNTSSDAPCKSSRPFLIDLNVADNSMLDDFASHSCIGDLPRNDKITKVRAFGGFDLNLNQLDEAAEAGQYSAVVKRKIEIPGLPAKPSILPNGESSARRTFDLNNGPMHEEVGIEGSLGQNMWSHLPSQPPVVNLQMNNASTGNFSSWFPQGNVLPAVTIPAVLPERGDHAFSIATSGAPQRIYYTPAGSTPFAPEIYRGPVLSSSPALSFPSAPYQYPMFPFGPSFQFPGPTLSGNTTYMDSSPGGRRNQPTGQSQYLGHPGLISTNYPRPYLVSVPDGRSNGSGLENRNRWGGSNGLDLNSGPGSIEAESRNDASSFELGQFSVAASSPAFTDDQARMFQAAAAASGVVMKRKEPDGGWGDPEKQAKQQPSWH